MLKRRTELFYEWDFEKNGELGLDIYKITFGTHRKAWWICPKCKNSYEANINNRASKGSNCPYCAGVRVLKGFNDMWTTNPELAKQLLNPDDGFKHMQSSNVKVDWLGKCGHKWEAMIADRTAGNGCHYCSGHRVLTGFNDLWTTHPEVAILLVNSEIGYIYSRGSSSVNTEWKCPDCNTIMKKTINTVTRQGLACTGCSDGIPFGERFLFHLLKANNIRFRAEKVFSWSNNKRYDFYLPDYNWIIEVHGIQHYETSPFHKRGQTLEIIQANDKWKHEAAISNGIEKYTVIDARESSVEHLSKSIENSRIREILNIVNYNDIGRLSYSSFVILACELWNSGMRSTYHIAKELGMYRYTVTKYLKRGAYIGLCDYCPIIASSLSREYRIERALENSRKEVD